MVIKQITGVATNLFAVFVLAIAGGIVTAQLHGELRDWAMFPEVLKDSSLYGLVAVCSWIVLKSPFAGKAIAPSVLSGADSQK